MPNNPAEFMKHMGELKTSQFQRFMSRNEIKLMISLVPETHPRELLSTLLESAFTSGATFGMTTATGEILKKAAEE